MTASSPFQRAAQERPTMLPSSEEAIFQVAQLDSAEAITRIVCSPSHPDWVQQLDATRRWISPPDEKRLLLTAWVKSECAGFAKVGWFQPPSEAPEHCAPAGFYLVGLEIRPEYRRRRLGHMLTQLRLRWIAERRHEVFYFADAENLASIALHQAFGFHQSTRHFWFPQAKTDPDHQILFHALLPRSHDPSP